MTKKEEAVLKYVNRIRAKYELAPLDALIPGMRLSQTQCPISRSIRFGTLLNVEVRPRAVRIRPAYGRDRDAKYFYPPKHVRDFISKIDAGKHKHLDATVAHHAST